MKKLSLKSVRKGLYSLCFLGVLCFITPSVFAVEEIFGGVDTGDLFIGSRFSLNQSYDLMLAYLEPDRLGLGIFYHDPDLSWDLVSKFDYWEGSLTGKFGSVYSAYDEITGKGSSDMALYFGRVKLLGNHYYDEATDSDRGFSMINYQGEVSESVLRWGFEDVLNNYSLRQSFKWPYNRINYEVQNNNFNEGVHGLIGEGQELSWENQAWGNQDGVRTF